MTRYALETPCKIDNGPADMRRIHSVRVTCGTYDSGRAFMVRDNWRDTENAHRSLLRAWQGNTYYFDETCADVDMCIAQMCALHTDVERQTCRTVRVNEDITQRFDITPYSEMYHAHPHHILSTKSGWKDTPSRADAFTGKSATVMKARRVAIRRRLRAKKCQTNTT